MQKDGLPASAALSHMLPVSMDIDAADEVQLALPTDQVHGPRRQDHVLRHSIDESQDRLEAGSQMVRPAG